MDHKDIIKDTDAFFEIDITKAITNKTNKTKVMQNDHKSEKFTFRVPQHIEGHDMQTCKVEVHYTNIDEETKEETRDFDELKDIQVHQEDGGYITLSWLLKRSATKRAGLLSFLIRFYCMAEDGTIEYEWNTEPYKAISVVKGMNNAAAGVEQYADELEQWRKSLLEEITKAKEEAIKDVNVKPTEAVEKIEEARDNAIDAITGTENEDGAQQIAIKAIESKTKEIIATAETAITGDSEDSAQNRAIKAIEDKTGEIIDDAETAINGDDEDSAKSKAIDAVEERTSELIAEAEETINGDSEDSIQSKAKAKIEEAKNDAIDAVSGDSENSAKNKAIKDVQTEGEKIANNASVVINNIMTAFADATAQIGAKGKEATDAVEDAQNTAIESISGAKDDALDSMNELYIGISKGMTGLSTEALEKIAEKRSEAEKAIDDKHSYVDNLLDARLSTGQSEILRVWGQAEDAIAEKHTLATDDITQKHTDAANDITTKHTGAVNDIIQKHTDAVNEMQIIADSLPSDYMELSEDVSNKANAIKGTASGEEVVITDLSPDTHTLNVKVSGVDNPENVTVARLGKNILCFNEDCTPTYYQNVLWEYKPDRQEFLLTGKSNSTAVNSFVSLSEFLKFEPFIRSSRKYAVTLEHISGSITGGTSVTGIKCYIGSAQHVLPFPTSENKTVTEIIDGNEGSEIMRLYFGAGTYNVVFNDYTFRMKLELGDTATEWEPATCTIYTPNADGIVEGMTSLYPTTTILTNTDNAVIECEYNRDINKALDAEMPNKEDVANALKKTVTGSKLTITDLSPLVDKLKVKVTQSYVDSPYMYKRIGENLWDVNIKLNSNTGEYESALYPCQGGDTFDLFSSDSAVSQVNITYYDINKQVISSGAYNPLAASMLIIPENCHYFKVHRVISNSNEGVAFQTRITLYQVKKYTAENGIITIPAPFDPVVYLYAKDMSSQFECEYNKDINKALEENWELIASGTLTKEVSSIEIKDFSCSKIALKMKVMGSATNTTDNAPLAVWANSYTNNPTVRNNNLTNIFRNTSTAYISPEIFLEVKNKSIVGQLFGTAGSSYGYLNREENEAITLIFLKPDRADIVFGVGTTYELWGVRK